MNSLWNVQVFDQGDLLSSDLVEDAEVQSMTTHFERLGYEVRSDIAWKPMLSGHLPPPAQLIDSEATIIGKALGFLEQRLRSDTAFASPSDVKEYCQLHIASEPDEWFCCLFLDSQHRLITFEKLFRGTVDGASVHPRVVVRRALEVNAAALILTHNHPSGLPKPSSADIKISQKLKEALALVDVRVLDHLIVGVEGTTSMAESALL